MSSGLNMSRRIRRTPYTAMAEKHGVRGFTVVNHMLLPKAYQPSVEEDYWHLREHVQIWDVSCQRQVEISGMDAKKLVQWMTPRDLSQIRIGQCCYTPLVDQDGGMINDPVLLKLAEDRYWFSIADSDVLLWAMGLAQGAGLNVSIHEPDVSPLAIQGPKAEDLLAEIFGEHVRQIGFFKFGWIEFRGTRQLLARSGFSKQSGFEIYLEGNNFGEQLWSRIWQAGEKYNITPGCPNLIERIEGGLLSYGNEFTRENNPLECGLEAFCNIDGGVDCIGLGALQEIAGKGVERQMRGVMFDGDAAPVCGIPWPVSVGTKQVGQITLGIWSPRLKRNIGLSITDKSHWDPGQEVNIDCLDGQSRTGEICQLPFPS